MLQLQLIQPDNMAKMLSCILLLHYCVFILILLCGFVIYLLFCCLDLLQLWKQFQESDEVKNLGKNFAQTFTNKTIKT